MPENKTTSIINLTNSSTEDLETNECKCHIRLKKKVIPFVAETIYNVGSDSLSVDSKWKDLARKLQLATGEIDYLGKQMNVHGTLTFQEVLIRILQKWKNQDGDASVENLVNILKGLNMVDIAESLMPQNEEIMRRLEEESSIFPNAKFSSSFKKHPKYACIFFIVLLLVLVLLLTAIWLLVLVPLNKDPLLSKNFTDGKNQSVINLRSSFVNESLNEFRSTSISCQNFHLDSQKSYTIASFSIENVSLTSQIFDEIEIKDLKLCANACKNVTWNFSQVKMVKKLVIKTLTGDINEDCLSVIISHINARILEIHTLDKLTINFPADHNQLTSIHGLVIKDVFTKSILKDVNLTASSLCKIFPNLQSFISKGNMKFIELLDLLKYCKRLENINMTIEWNTMDGVYNVYTLNKGRRFLCIHLKFIMETCPSYKDIKDLGLEDFKTLGKQVSYEGLDCVTNFVTDQESYKTVLAASGSSDLEVCRSRLI